MPSITICVVGGAHRAGQKKSHFLALKYDMYKRYNAYQEGDARFTMERGNHVLPKEETRSLTSTNSFHIPNRYTNLPSLN